MFQIIRLSVFGWEVADSVGDLRASYSASYFMVKVNSSSCYLSLSILSGYSFSQVEIASIYS